MKDLHVSWEEYRRLIETLAFNVYDSGWKFDSSASEHFVDQLL